MATDDVLLVFTSAAEGREDEFNEWYDATHLPEVLDIPGVVGARRYRPAEGAAPQAHQYLAIYRLDRPANEVTGELFSRMSSGQMSRSDAMDMTAVSLVAWTPLGAEQVSANR